MYFPEIAKLDQWSIEGTFPPPSVYCPEADRLISQAGEAEHASESEWLCFPLVCKNVTIMCADHQCTKSKVPLASNIASFPSSLMFPPCIHHIFVNHPQFLDSLIFFLSFLYSFEFLSFSVVMALSSVLSSEMHSFLLQCFSSLIHS